VGDIKRVAQLTMERRGGDRIIYVFGGTHMPMFLVTVFAKNEKDNLTKAEQVTAIRISKILVDPYGVGQ